MNKKCLFLDRDGVVCEYLDKYLIDPTEFKVLDGIEDLIREAKARGFLVVMVTN